METYTNYKGYGIRYVQVTGTTYVEDTWGIIEEYPFAGMLEGERMAKEYIDGLAHNEKAQLLRRSAVTEQSTGATGYAQF